MRMKYHKVVKGMMGSRQKAAMECKHLLVWWPFLNLGDLVWYDNFFVEELD
jgi:hypothetical protein